MDNKIELEKLSKKERRDYLKNLRSEQQSKERKTTLVFTLVLVVGLIIAGIGLYWLAGSGSGSSVKELGVHVDPPAPPNDRMHIQPGQSHVAYTSNPPTSGPHYSGPGIGPIPCQVYTKEIADESVIHNLEHGAVWISYQDKNDTTLANELKQIAESNAKVVLSPRAKDDSKIAVVAWERLLKLNTFDKQKIEDFVKLYRDYNLVPERFASCG